MLRGEFFERIVRTVCARSTLTIAVAAVLALAGAVLAAGLQPSTAIDTLVDRDSPEFVATERAQEVFGDDAVVILVRGDLQNTLLTPDLGRLRDFEDCIAASPRGLEIAERPTLCDELAELAPAKVVYGPGTFIGRAADELAAGFQEQLGARDQRAVAAADRARAEAREARRTPAEQRAAAAEARATVEQEFQQQIIGLALRYNLTGPPAISDPQFVSQLVFDTSKGVNVPKARFSYLFPSSQAALIQVRLRPDMTEAERERAIALIEEAAELPRFQPQRGGEYVVTGVPVVIDSLAAAIERSLIVLLIGSVLVMAATLALVFRSPRRLLPLLLALGAAAVSFGLVALAGGGLTMASVA
ncbi:MAG: MMPL family transporter, partial [Thermoleophilaceae bacterium]|nr:MMPL family transporter [Thermoleophilaceae bacterium]